MPLSDELISQIVSMGFDVEAVRAALNHFNADVDQVIMELVQRAGNIPDDWYHAVPAAAQPSATSTSSSNTTSSSDSGLNALLSFIVSSVVVAILELWEHSDVLFPSFPLPPLLSFIW